MTSRGKRTGPGTVLIALGANLPGCWGPPAATLLRACRELERIGARIVRVSNVYETKPVGNSPQPPYLNAVLLAVAHLAPAQLLRLVKQIEWRAGRRQTRTMAPRALDIDILDQFGRRFGWPVPRSRKPGRLILPHPGLHTRAFVLVPLLEVVPAWRHPVSGVLAKTLLLRLNAHDRAGVRQALDFPSRTCDKQLS
jgi:2-amino-4-hydroxy-6-hydroxymethyldihydropteridine diphosphokinase